MVSTPQQQSLGATALDRARAGARILRNNPPAAFGLALVLVYVFIALAGPAIAPYPYDEFAVGPPLDAPSIDHPFGTDEFGRDVLSRVLHGGRISLRVGALVVIIAGGIGVSVGLSAGSTGDGSTSSP